MLYDDIRMYIFNTDLHRCSKDEATRNDLGQRRLKYRHYFVVFTRDSEWLSQQLDLL